MAIEYKPPMDLMKVLGMIALVGGLSGGVVAIMSLYNKSRK